MFKLLWTSTFVYS